ncbi:hypothetical protein OAS86_04740 [Gammaproteobacteria bacterium]|nr:hypothetical protein [Gammaproteobacteria bacterium]
MISVSVQGGPGYEHTTREALQIEDGTTLACLLNTLNLDSDDTPLVIIGDRVCQADEALIHDAHIKIMAPIRAG